MARGSKRSYTSKQRRRASSIEDNGKSRGTSTRAKQMANATVNTEEGGGGKKSGRGRGKAAKRTASRRGGRKTSSRRM